MSLSNLLKDVFTGNETNALARLKDWWSGVSPAVQAFIQKAETDEGKILEGLVAVAVKDVEAQGFTTAAFVTAGKDVLAQLVAQNISTFTIQHVIGMINIEAAPLVSAVVAAPVVEEAPVADAPVDPASAA